MISKFQTQGFYLKYSKDSISTWFRCFTIVIPKVMTRPKTMHRTDYELQKKANS